MLRSLTAACLLLGTASLTNAPATASGDSSVSDFASVGSGYEWWRVGRLPRAPAVDNPAIGTRSSTPRHRTGLWRDRDFRPPMIPSREGVPVEQVVVTSEELAPSFAGFADHETRRGIPSVVRTVAWIERNYSGVDTPARIRAFLRHAHDAWDTRFVLLGGGPEHVPVRYIAWGQGTIPTDTYYECLDRDWNEDGDAHFGEPMTTGDFTDQVNDVAVDAHGKIWLATNVGVAFFESGTFTTFDRSDGLPSSEILTVEIAPDGSVWVGTPEGAAVREAGRWRTFTESDGLPSNAVVSILPLSANEAWLGTAGGLAHSRHGEMSTWTEAEGLPGALVTSIAIVDGALWAGTFRGAARLEGGELSVFHVRNSGIFSNWILSIEPDGTGGVWFGHENNSIARGGLSHFDGETWSTDDLSETEGLAIRSIAVGPGADEIWAATSRGLFHRSTGADELLDEKDGLAGSDLLSLVRTGAEALALGGTDGLTVGGPHAWRVFTQEDGLPSTTREFDEIDLVPELTAGRIPAVTRSELEVYLEKLRAYERGVGVDRVASALFLGENLFQSGDGRQLCKRAIEHFPASYASTELYEVEGTQNAATSLQALNDGPGVVVHVGHGSYDVMGVGSGMELLFNSDLDRIDSGGRYSFYVVYACDSGGFDQNSSMERLLFNPRGGAIATMANSRTAIADIDSDFNEYFYEDLFGSWHGRPAVSLRAVRADRVNASPELYRLEGWTRRMFHTRSFLGAPTLSLWREHPGSLAVDHPETVPLRRAPLTITVRDEASGEPVANALVALSKGLEDYAYGRTDESGIATFDFRPESPGEIEVRVTSASHLPYEGFAIAAEPRRAHPVAAGWNVSGMQIGPEETRMLVELGVRNLGRTAKDAWNLRLVTADRRVRVVEGDVVLPALDAGELAWTEAFTLVVDPAVGSERFRVVLSGSGESAFSEEYWLTARLPEIELRGFERHNDGFHLRIENRGNVTSAVSASLAALSPEGEVVVGTIVVPEVAPGETVVSAGSFQVRGPANAPYRLTLSDRTGRRWNHEVDFDPPRAPRSATAQPLDEGARLSWTRSASLDVAGYRVLELAEGDPREISLVREAALVEVALPAGSSRDYAILAIDDSGHESADSCFVTAHAQPPTLEGWPQTLSSIVGPSPILGADLDGDGGTEILLGSMWDANAIHVFRADGSEWTDGDQNANTNGIFGKTGGRVHAAPLLLDVDGDGANEVFVGSFDGFLHGWRSDGTPLPGWPVALAFNGARTSPVAADLDGDGEREIVVVAIARKVFAFEADGAPVPGWPRETGAGGLGSQPAVYDLNRDGLEDVVFCATDGRIYVVSGDGTDLPGWPVSVGSPMQSSPVLVDVDDDGDPEIFALARDGSIWGFQHDDTDGTPGADLLPGWPVSLPANGSSPPSPAVADFDGDGTPEIVVNGNGFLAIHRADGTEFPGWPLATGSQGANSPVVADLDGDGSLDVLAGSSDYRLGAYRSDGTVLPGWPRIFHELPNATPYVTDVDRDGDLDVILGADDLVIRVLDVKGRAAPGAAPWPGYHGRHGARGVYVHVPLEKETGPTSSPDPEPLRLLSASPNPFRAGTELRFSVPLATPVRLEVFDVAGRRVAFPLRGRHFPAGSHSIFWNGEGRDGRTLPAGVYFLRLRVGGEVRTGKVLRLR